MDHVGHGSRLDQASTWPGHSWWPLVPVVLSVSLVQVPLMSGGRTHSGLAEALLRVLGVM